MVGWLGLVRLLGLATAAAEGQSERQAEAEHRATVTSTGRATTRREAIVTRRVEGRRLLGSRVVRHVVARDVVVVTTLRVGRVGREGNWEERDVERGLDGRALVHRR